MSKAYEIKKVSLELFAYKGYEGTSIENIAAEVGIKKASIYSHIKSKEELFITLLEDVLEWDKNYFNGLLENNTNIDVKEKIYLFFQHYCRVYQEAPNRTKMMFLNRAMIFPPEFLKQKAQLIFTDNEVMFSSMLIGVIQEGLVSGVIREMPIDDIISFFYCTVDGLFVESCYYTQDEYNRRSHSIWSLFWHAIKA